MTREEMIRLFSENALEAVTQNQATISEHILDFVHPEDDEHQIYAKMTYNAIRLAVQISCASTASLLMGLGVLEPSDFSLVQRKQNVIHLKFEK